MNIILSEGIARILHDSVFNSEDDYTVENV